MQSCGRGRVLDIYCTGDTVRPVLDETRFFHILREGLAHGSAEPGPNGTVSWTVKVSGDCRSPRVVQLTGHMPRSIGDMIGAPPEWREIQPGAKQRVEPGYTWVPGQRSYRALDLWVRCRTCDLCLRQRSRLWRNRAKVEIAISARTWLGTLTLNPSEQYRLGLLAMSHARSRAVEISSVTDEELFSRKCVEFGRHITLYLKRVRKVSGAKLRYLLVFERHKTGLPHAHMLVHETSIDQPVRHAVLKEHWRLGFSDFKLADQKAAGYVSKYLSKSMLARVRASLRYGSDLVS